MTDPNASKPKRRSRTKEEVQAEGRFVVALGDQKDPWFDFCRARNMTPTVGIRRAVHRLMNGKPEPKVFGVRPVIEGKNRVVVRLTESEEAAARSRAAAEGFASHNLWVAAVVRAALTNTPQFGKTEIDALGQSNLELLRIGRNLNQIAKRLNAAQSDGDLRAYDSELVENLAAAVRKHVKKVGDALRASIYRWGLTGYDEKRNG